MVSAFITNQIEIDEISCSIMSRLPLCLIAYMLR